MLHPKNPAGHLEHEWEFLSLPLMGYAAGLQNAGVQNAELGQTETRLELRPHD